MVLSGITSRFEQLERHSFRGQLFICITLRYTASVSESGGSQTFLQPKLFELVMPTLFHWVVPYQQLIALQNHQGGADQ